VYVCVCVRVCMCVCVCRSTSNIWARQGICVSVILSLSLSFSLTHCQSLSSTPLSTKHKKKTDLNFLFLQDLARSVRVQARSGSLLYIHFSVYLQFHKPGAVGAQGSTARASTRTRRWCHRESRLVCELHETREPHEAGSHLHPSTVQDLWFSF